MKRSGIIIPKGMTCDHINHNPLDNRRCNLRVASYYQQTLNRRFDSPTSKYKGVCWRKDAQKFRAQAQLHGQKVSIGHFDVEEEAARAYDRAVWTHYKDTENAPFVYLNFPDELR